MKNSNLVLKMRIVRTLVAIKSPQEDHIWGWIHMNVTTMLVIIQSSQLATFQWENMADAVDTASVVGDKFVNVWNHCFF